MAIPQPQGLITVDEYERMIADGVLTKDDKVELIGGEIVPMAPIGVRHVDAIYSITDLLMDAALKGVTVSVQCPVRLEESEPEPDLMLVHRKRYRSSIATPADVFLLIEIADSTIESDRRAKFPRYAAAGIAEAWLVDIKGGTLERHTQPRENRYAMIDVARRGESLPSVVFPSLVFDVDAILAPVADE